MTSAETDMRSVKSEVAHQPGKYGRTKGRPVGGTLAVGSKAAGEQQAEGAAAGGWGMRLENAGPRGLPCGSQA